MNLLLGWVRLYGEVATSLSVLTVIVLCVQRWMKSTVCARSQLHLCYFLFSISLFLPCAFNRLPQESLPRPSVQVFSGSTRGQATPVLSGDIVAQAVTPGAGRAFLSFETRWLFYGGLFAALLLLFSIARIGVGAWRLHRHLRSLPSLRRLGRVRVLISSDGCVPFAALGVTSRYVVLPAQYLLSPTKCRMSLRHEAAHLKNGDLFFLWLGEVLRVLYFWNPFVGVFIRRVRDIQEFACDEHVVGHHRYSPHAYGSCLLEAAQWAVSSRSRLAGTTGMAWEGDGSELKRRIQMILDKKSGTRKNLSRLVVVTLVLLVAGCSFYTRSVVQQRNLSLAEAKRYAEIAASRSKVPVDMNDLVFERLNTLISTPKGRKWVADAFARLPQYQPMIQNKFAEHEAPEELVSLALHESGMNNEAVSGAKAAGIWQFVPGTARRYNLLINDKIDERTDVEKETVAAARYLKDLYDMFGDWRLAVKAYNEGENRVASLIKKHGTRDPWALEKASSTESYLSGAIAMLILYRNPELLASL